MRGRSHVLASTPTTAITAIAIPPSRNGHGRMRMRAGGTYGAPYWAEASGRPADGGAATPGAAAPGAVVSRGGPDGGGRWLMPASPVLLRAPPRRRRSALR